MIAKKQVNEALSLVSQAMSLVEACRDEAQEKFDEKSDNWKEGDAGQAMEEKISNLSSALDHLNDCDSELQSAIGD